MSEPQVVDLSGPPALDCCFKPSPLIHGRARLASEYPSSLDLYADGTVVAHCGGGRVWEFGDLAECFETLGITLDQVADRLTEIERKLAEIDG